jgi:hypothetical protein
LADVLLLTWLGGQEITPITSFMGQCCTAYLFLYLLVCQPLVGYLETQLMHGKVKTGLVTTINFPQRIAYSTAANNSTKPNRGFSQWFKITYQILMHPLLPLVLGCMCLFLCIIGFDVAALTLLVSSFETGLFIICFNALRLYYRPFDLLVTPIVGEIAWLQSIRQGAKYMGLAIGGTFCISYIVPMANLMVEDATVTQAIRNVDRINVGLEISPAQRKLEIQAEIQNLRNAKSIFPRVVQPLDTNRASQIMSEFKELRSSKDLPK